MTVIRWTGTALLAATVGLAGCATSYTLESNVQSFSALSPSALGSGTYRFERLPLQQADPGQVQVELMAATALQQAGLRRDDATPRYGVQVAAKNQRMVSPFASPWGYGPWGWGGWGPPGGWGYAAGWGGRNWGAGWGYESDWFHREVSVIVRDLSTQQVVYETHAVSDSPWRDSVSVLPAMFQAALQGFPTPPPGPRRVDVQIGGPAPAATVAPLNKSQ